MFERGLNIKGDVLSRNICMDGKESWGGRERTKLF